MASRKFPPSKDRRDIGQVVFPIEQMLEARELSSCCIGAEARLETNRGFTGLTERLSAFGRKKPDPSAR